MKTKKILAVFCCALLLLSMAGCFPFNMLKDAMQNNNGGADGPTSIIVTSEPSEEPSVEPWEEPSEDFSEYNFNFDGFEELEIPEDPAESSEPSEPSDTSSDLYNATAVWYGYEDEDALWLFFDTYAVLYEDAYNYSVASYAYYYDEDAIRYIANDLSEYGFTEEEQRESIGELEEGEKYFCIVFSDIEVYEDDSYAGPYEDDILPFVGFEYKQDGVAMYDLINMSNKEFATFYTFGSATTTTDTNDTQRIGDELCGYTDVPADYVEYSDIYSDNTMIQYSDPTGTNIVTMTYYNKSQYDAKSLADYMMNLLYADSEIDHESITGAMVDLDGSQAYQIYGYYPNDDMYLVVYILDSPYDDENLHYLAIEFVSSDIALVEMVEYNYHVSY